MIGSTGWTAPEALRAEGTQRRAATPVKSLTEPVTLERIKAHPELSQMSLVRRSRLSVTPVTDAEFRLVLEESKTKL